MRSHISYRHAESTNFKFGLQLTNLFSDSVSVSKTESVEALRRTIHLLINHGNYASARNYIGAALKKIYRDLTLGEEKCAEVRHESTVLSMMEAFLADTIKIVGNLRYGAVFDLIIKKENLSILKSSAKSELSLAEKITRLAKNGCFGVYQSKVS